jgi:hypothetical protein
MDGVALGAYAIGVAGIEPASPFAPIVGSDVPRLVKPESRGQHRVSTSGTPIHW